MADLSLSSMTFSSAHAAADQPHAAVSAFATFCAARFGLKLLTVFAWDEGDDLCVRIWSNQPESYPFPATKRMGPTEWGYTVLRERQPWCGRTRREIRAAFFDHELIESLGCGACLSAPIVWRDRVIGAVSVLDAEGAYGPADAEALGRITWTLIPALLTHRIDTAGQGLPVEKEKT
ncbi:GAF domain-containing protein [Halodurantibacterium flavum]|uniref:GAF domain-containing protein n=1 Tax=Halodurantibacterium flavum TaxID=1382802 RepID=A0ABW4S0K0_9RHOB